MGRLLNGIFGGGTRTPAVSPHRPNPVTGGIVYLEAVSYYVGDDRDEVVEEMRNQLKHNRSWLYLKDEALRTPLHFAALYGNRAMAQSLIELGVNVDAKDTDGCTPLHLAFQMPAKGPSACRESEPKAEVAELLIKAGANIRFKDRTLGASPLHYSVAHEGFVRIAEMLIHMGADVNAVDKNGDTPLHKASTPLYRTLLTSKGADETIRNAVGRVPGQSTPP